MNDEAGISAVPEEASATRPGPTGSGVDAVLGALTELGEDLTVPRNIRRGALAAKAELERRSAALDVRISGAVSRLDDLANDPNLPTHGRTAIWSLISRLESLQ